MKNEDVATSSIEELTKRVPSVGFLGLAVGAMAVSATLMMLGRKKWANFVGQWAPTILILGTYNKLVKTFSAPYSEEQRVQPRRPRLHPQVPRRAGPSAATRPLI